MPRHENGALRHTFSQLPLTPRVTARAVDVKASPKKQSPGRKGACSLEASLGTKTQVVP